VTPLKCTSFFSSSSFINSRLPFTNFFPIFLSLLSYFPRSFFLSCRDSSVAIVTGLQVWQARSWSSMSGRERRFCLIQNVQTRLIKKE
jgi:hypothetical protein